LEFNIPFQHKYGYIRDERVGRKNQLPVIVMNVKLYRPHTTLYINHFYVAAWYADTYRLPFFVGVCWSGRQRNWRTLAGHISWRGFQNGNLAVW